MEKLKIHGVHTEVDEKLKRYITKKINKLERYVPSHSKESMHVEVYVEESKTHNGKQCECEVNMYLPHEILRVRESTVNMFAAVDIVEAKLKQSLLKYKAFHGDPRYLRRLLNRINNS